MTTKERKKLEGICTRTQMQLQEAGYKAVLVVGKDVSEMRDSIKRTFLGLLQDADLDELREATERLMTIRKTREANKPKAELKRLTIW